MSLELIVIAAVSENGVIGKDNCLPWNIPQDLARFKQLTSNHPIIMGKNTYESIGRALPHRLNIVLSKTRSDFAGAHAYTSLGDAINDLSNNSPPAAGIDYSQVFVIGGQKIYQEALLLADRLEITHVYQTIEGEKIA